MQMPTARLVLLVLVLNAISSVVFISRVNWPVYDDKYNIFDVHNYAKNGLSADTLQNHRNPPGPTSFLWMAGAVRLWGGEELRDARLGALSSVMLLSIGVLVGARYTKFAELWYAALLALLVFPHAVESMATVLTEGPALMFGVLGALAWAEFVSSRSLRGGQLLSGLISGLSLGLAVTCRQYSLALVAAAGLVAVSRVLQEKENGRNRSLWAVSTAVCLAMGILPVAHLAVIWHGLSSPGMASGTSYNMRYQTAVGLNFSRPLIAGLYTAIYLLPLTFPLMKRMKREVRPGALAVALLGGLAGGIFSRELLQPGPVNSVVVPAARIPHGADILFGLITAVALYNLIAVGLELWEQRAAVLSSVPAMFALLAIGFFVAEQLGVGGNIPFYDRYILLVAPFLGLLAFSLLPRLDKPRIFALVALCLIANFILWRHAFGA